MCSRIKKFIKSIRNRYHNGLPLLIIVMVMLSCRKEATPERVTSYYGKSYTEIFEAFWNGMNSNYIFWDIETVNWDNMYKTYKPRFEYLDQQKKDPQSAQKAVQYLVDMTKDLSDSHLDLTFNGNASFVVSGYPIQATDFHPSSIRHQLRGDRSPIPAKVFEEIILDGLPQVLWPDHCVQETVGAQFSSLLHTRKIEAIFRKGMDINIDSYSGFFDNGKKKATGMGAYLKGRGITHIYVAGLAADYCVKFTALDGLELGFKSTIIIDATRAIDPENFKKNLKSFQEKGGKEIKSEEINF